MNLLRVIGGCFCVGCGWFWGDWFCLQTQRHLDELDCTIRMLCRTEQEIACCRTDLEQLYQAFCRDGTIPPGQQGGTFFRVAPPDTFSRREADCLRECLSGLGHADAVRECSRLRLYIGQLETMREDAGRAAENHLALFRKLGLGAGLAAAILLW